jgi:transcriptional regulator with XRE-family HTH domain
MLGTSPIARQRELGIKLRALRSEHGMTVEEVAEQLLCSATKISLLETGSRRPSLRDVRDLCLDGQSVPAAQRLCSSLP